MGSWGGIRGRDPRLSTLEGSHCEGQGEVEYLDDAILYVGRYRFIYSSSALRENQETETEERRSPLTNTGVCIFSAMGASFAFVQSFRYSEVNATPLE